MVRDNGNHLVLYTKEYQFLYIYIYTFRDSRNIRQKKKNGIVVMLY